MKNYKIQILEDAKEDIKEIIAYIKNKLKEPEIAKQHKKAFKDAIKELKDTASIYNVIDEETIEIKNIRKIIESLNVPKGMGNFDTMKQQ